MSETEVQRGDEDSEERRGSRFCHQLCHGLVTAIKRCALVLPSCPPQMHFLMNSLMHIVSLCLHTLWQMVGTNLYPHRQDSVFLIMTALKLFSQMKMPGESGRDIVQTFLICKKQQDIICISHSCTDRNSLCGFDKKGTNICVT